MPELERMSINEFRESKKLPIVIVLDEVRSMNNVGSVFRSADAFLVEAIYLCGFTPIPPHRDIQKTALGATETVTWKHLDTTREAIETLRQQGYIIYSIEQVHDSVMLQTMNIEKIKICICIW